MTLIPVIQFTDMINAQNEDTIELFNFQLHVCFSHYVFHYGEHLEHLG